MLILALLCLCTLAKGAAGEPRNQVEQFCTAVVRDFGSGLPSARGTTGLTQLGKLPFGPGNLRVHELGTVGKQGVLIRGKKIGYGFLAINKPVRLGWKVSVHVKKVGKFDRSTRALTRSAKRLGLVGILQQPKVWITVPQSLGAYKITILIRNHRGRYLGSLVKYVKRVRRLGHARLDVREPTANPGQTIVARVANPGTIDVIVKPSFTVEYLNGLVWEGVDAVSHPVPLSIIGAEPGGSAGCITYTIPYGARSGRYRLRRSIRFVGDPSTSISIVGDFDVSAGQV